MMMITLMSECDDDNYDCYKGLFNDDGLLRRSSHCQCIISSNSSSSFAFLRISSCMIPIWAPPQPPNGTSEPSGSTTAMVTSLLSLTNSLTFPTGD